jgi:hypothetical protein
MPRERRQAVQTNAAMYVGYADDDEDVDSIMKKFKALEEVEAKRSAGGADLSEEELVKAVGLRVGCGVDYSMDADRAGAGGASGSRHRGPKGEHVQTGVVQIVPKHVAPEELDAADAEDAKRRLKAGANYLPPAQRRDEQITMPSLVPLELNKDVVMVELEGVDARCREAAFASLPSSASEEERHAFLDALIRHLRLMAVRNTKPTERTLENASRAVVEALEKEKGTTALKTTSQSQSTTSAPLLTLDVAKKCAAALTRAVAREKTHSHSTKSNAVFRVRSKGTGLICVRPGGIPRNTYLGAYCGELYPGWRWYEKEAAAQAVRRDVRRDDEVPVFYNAAVERDGDDPRGYDCLFIDGQMKGSILTRASHSCAPNAAMRVRVRDGSYAVEMASIERVEVGDEICWDYRCRTDSEKEMRAALCLCGSRECRVSYLHFAGHDDASFYVKKRGTVAHFTAALLRACGPCGDGRATPNDGSVDAADAAAAAAADAALARRAARAGFKVGTRDSPGALYGLPAWLARYVAFCVEFVREEREALERVLEARFRAENDAANANANANADADANANANANPSLGASSAEGAALEAKAEAEGVAAARLQSLAVTLDKVRHVLSEACGGEDKLATAPPPLAALDDAAAAAHLAATRRRVADAARALGVAVPDGVPRLAGEKTKSEYDELVDARRALAELATFLRSLEKSELSLENANDGSSGLPIVDFESVAAAARAAADLCDLASITKTFFRAVPSKPFDSPFVQVGAYGGDAGTVRRASYGPLVVWAFLATWHCEFEEHAELSLDVETRGATRLPRPDGPLRRAFLTGSNGKELTSGTVKGGAFSAKSKTPRGPIGAQSESFTLELLDARSGGAFESWPAVRGWEWSKLRDVADAILGAKKQSDKNDTRLCGSDGVFGSPSLDEALAEEEDLEDDSLKTFQDARKRLVTARSKKRDALEKREDDEDALRAAACVPAWNADRGLGATFVASVGGLVGPRRRAPRATFVAAVKETGVKEKERTSLTAAPSPLPRDDTTRLVERAMAEVANTLAGGVKGDATRDAGDTKAEVRETEISRDSENVAPTSRPRAPAYGDAFDASAKCAGCGGLGADGHFLLCQGCPSGGHLDCLGLTRAPEGRWECEACEGGRLAGIRPPGRAGFEAAAAAAAAAGKVGGPASGAAGAAGGVAGLSVVPGAVAPVPSVGPLAMHHLAASVVVDFVKGGAAAREAAEAAAARVADAAEIAAGSKRSAREAFLDESADDFNRGGLGSGTHAGVGKQGGSGFGSASPHGAASHAKKRVEASFPMPRTCASAIAVECGGALGEFRVTEGLVHCFCRGCQAACEIGLQPTNVFGLQAFEFHGGKGNAGKWKASVKAFPNGFPPELVAAEPGEDVPVRRDAGEPLGNWLERECPEHPVLSRSRPSKDA